MARTSIHPGRRRSNSRKGFTLRQPLIFALVILAIMIIAYVRASVEARENSETIPPLSANELLRVVIPDSLPATPVSYTGFEVSFNPRLHIPNYVAWELTDAETRGTYPRKNNFHTDENVPGCAETYDYLYSGYDRGHMAPAADMKWDSQAMDDSFVFTNMCPQDHSLNTGAWQVLEDNCRKWACRDSALVIITGPILNPLPHEYIGDNRVAVPQSFFKVVLAPYARPVRAIAFHMPNGYIKGGMQATVTTVDKIEALTGFDFFSALPDSIEEIVESRSDLNLWNSKSTGKK